MGLDTAQSFVLGLLSLVMIGVVFMIVLTQLGNTPAVSITETSSASVADEAGWINSSGYTVDEASASGFSNLNITSAVNASDGTLIEAGNYTYDTSTGVVLNATSIEWNSVKFNYTYDYSTPTKTGEIIHNATSGASTFFSNIPTWLSLVAIVILILIIAVVIVVVKRFGGVGGAGNAGSL